jgi:hypothetical protein
MSRRFPPPAAALRKAARITVLMLLPLVAVALVAGGESILPAMMALMAAAVVPFCTRRQALFFTVGLIATGVAAVAAAGAFWAVVGLVVVSSLVAGLASRVSAGVFGVAPVTAVVLGTEGQDLSVWRTGLVMAGVVVYVIVIMALGKIHIPATPVPWGVAVRHALVMALACGSATALVLHYDWPRGYWLVMTLAVVLRPYVGDSLHREVQRVVGTVAGAVIAGMLSPLPRPGQFVLAAACMMLMLAYAMLKDYVLQVTFLTPMVVFLVGSGTIESTLSEDLRRVVYTVGACLVGGALALLLARKEESA